MSIETFLREEEERFINEMIDFVKATPDPEERSKKRPDVMVSLLRASHLRLLEEIQKNVNEKIEDEKCNCYKCLEAYECSAEEHRRAYREVLALLSTKEK